MSLLSLILYVVGCTLAMLFLASRIVRSIESKTIEQLHDSVGEYQTAIGALVLGYVIAVGVGVAAYIGA